MPEIVGVHYVRVGTRWYVYAWRGGPRIATVEGGAKPRLSRELEDSIRAARSEAGNIGSDTLGGLIRDWHRSPEWAALAPSTRSLWDDCLTRIEGKWGALPIALWSDSRMVGKVVAWRDSMAPTPRAADEAVKVLGRLLEWGRLRARVTVNVAAGVPGLYRGADRCEIIWTPDDYDRFRWAAERMEVPHALDILELGGLSGFRRADLAAVRRAEAANPHAIIRTALKRSRGRRRRAAVPKLPETHDLLDRLGRRARKDGVETLLVNGLGRAWAPRSLGECFHRVRDHAGIVEPANDELGLPARPKHLHDLRGTFVTKLCRARLTDEEIANIVAWSPQSVARIRRTYVDDAAIVVALSERINAAL